MPVLEKFAVSWWPQCIILILLFDHFSSAKNSSDVKPPLMHRLQPQDRTLPAPRYWNTFISSNQQHLCLFSNGHNSDPLHVSSRVVFSRSANQRVLFPIGSNTRWRLAAVLKISSEHIYLQRGIPSTSCMHDHYTLPWGTKHSTLHVYTCDGRLETFRKW